MRHGDPRETSRPADVLRRPLNRCEWPGDGDGPSVRAWFKGFNQLGRLRFAAKCEVVAADEGREFAFRRTAPGQRGEVVWRYRFKPDDGGTRVVESYEVVRPPPRPLVWFMSRVAGVAEVDPDVAAVEGMRTTPDRSKEEFEESSARTR